MKGRRTVVASIAWRHASRRLPWRPEPMTLWEHFALTAFIAGGWVFPYLMAAL